MFLTSLVFCALSLFGVYTAQAQGLVSEFADSGEFTSEIFTEKIKVIARSKKIFILTNDNQELSQGDYVTLSIPKSGPVARALVAKIHQGNAGIKIMKIYSLKRWAVLRNNLEVELLKGDDSRLFRKKTKKSDDIKEEDVAIKSEEDLYNDTSLLGDDPEFDNKDMRHIKPDNIVSLSWGRYQFENTIDNDIETSNQFFGQWAYQFGDNYWLEGVYGRVLIDNFPARGTQTLINNFIGRFKYIFKAPLYSYLMPYIGFQQMSVSSPEAGNTNDANLAAQEIALVDSLAESGIVIGVSVLRRMVPGWFVKADLGTDAINIGFAIEF